MLNVPTLGVVVPTRNSAATLDATLLSLASQQGVCVDTVVADSDSTDGTRDICARWGVRTLSTPPGNMYRAINDGLRVLGHCEWLTYLNSDDLAYPDGYARLVARGQAGGFDVVYGNGDFVDERGAFVWSQASFGPAILERQLACGSMPFVQPAAVFRQAVFERLGGFDERFTCIADLDFFMRASAARFRFGKTGGRAVAGFRVHDAQLSTVRKAVVDREQKARRRECGRLRVPARMALSAAWKVRNTFNYLAWLVGSW